MVIAITDWKLNEFCDRLDYPRRQAVPSINLPRIFSELIQLIRASDRAPGHNPDSSHICRCC